jgi:hypothetical protein
MGDWDIHTSRNENERGSISLANMAEPVVSSGTGIFNFGTLDTIVELCRLVPLLRLR